MMCAAKKCRATSTLVLLLGSFSCLGEELVLTDVPNYIWTHGCSPTSGMRLFGYWDNYGFPNLIPGSSNWTTNYQAIQEAIASSGNGRYSSTGTIYEPGTPGTGHVPDYALYDGQNDETWFLNYYKDLSELAPQTAHADNCLADFMRTSRSSEHNVYGATQPGDISPGMSNYAAYRGYSFDASHEGILTLSWNKFTHEIDFGRPVVISVDTNGDFVRDHTVTGIGYRYLDGKQQYACLDSGGTWEWHDFQQALPLPVEYGVWDLDCARPAGTHDTEWTPPSGWWGDSPNWDHGPPDATAFAYIPDSTTAIVNGEATACFIHNVGSIHMDGGALTAGQVRNAGVLIGNGTLSADVKNFGQIGAALGDLTFSGDLTNYERVFTRPGHSLQLEPSTTLTNMESGTIEQGGDSVVRMNGQWVPSGYMWAPAPAVIDNRDEGVYDLLGDGSILLGAGSPSENWIDNAGEFRKSGGTGESVIEAAFNNTGTVKVDSGVLALKGGGEFSNATTFIADGASLRLMSSVTVSADSAFNGLGAVDVVNGGRLDIADGVTVHGSGPIMVNGGGLSGAGLNSGFGPDTDIRFLSGFLQGDGIAVAGSLSWTGDPADERRIASSTLTNTGTIRQVGDSSVTMCGFTLSPWGPWPALIDNKPAGVYDLSGDGDILLGTVETRDGPVQASPAYNVMSNQGSFRKSGGTRESVIEATFNNTGTVEVLSGTLAFQGGFKQTAGSVRLNGGSISSTMALSITGGSIEGSGNILADVLNEGGTVSPGLSPGMLTIEGDYTQASDATLLLEIAGVQPGQFDVFNVTGTATLGGFLEIDFLNDFRPTLGDTFDFFNYGSCVGEFDSIYVRGFPDYGFIPTYGLTSLTIETDSVPPTIPVPSSVCLAAIGAMASLRWRSRRERT